MYFPHASFMRGALAALLGGSLLLASCCRCEPECRSGTVLLTLTYPAGLPPAETVEVRVTGDGFAPPPLLARPGTERDTVEIVLPAQSMYVIGQSLDVDVVLRDAQKPLAHGQTKVVLLPDCTASELALLPQSPSAPRISARSAHTATLLSEGRVLLVGGVSEPFTDSARPVTAQAELYDPGVNEVVRRVDLTVGRALHTATLLSDLRVLITGGESDGVGALADLELYDPARGMFFPEGKLIQARRMHTATVVTDGLVLLAGGASGTGRAQSLASAELYVPGAGSMPGTIQESASMREARQGHTATLLQDGQVLMVGGIGAKGVLASAERFDPLARVFNPTGKLSIRRCFHQAILLENGEVLIMGGSSEDVPGSPSIATAELYNPGTGQFRPTGSLNVPRQNYTASKLLDGRVMVAGGASSYQALPALADVEVYDPLLGVFTSSPLLHFARQWHTATPIQSGAVLIAGGHGPASVVEVEIDLLH